MSTESAHTSDVLFLLVFFCVRQGILVQVLWGYKGALMFSFLSRKILTVVFYFVVCYKFFLLLNWPPLHAEHLQYCHNSHHHTLTQDFPGLGFHSSFFCSFSPSSRHIRIMKLLSHQQESFIFSWSCHTLSARFSTCVSLRSTQKRRLSGPFSQPLHASLGAESGPQAVHTHAERQLWPRRHRLPNGCVGVGLAVPS